MATYKIEERIADYLKLNITNNPGYYNLSPRDKVCIDDGGNAHYFYNGVKIFMGNQWVGKWTVLEQHFPPSYTVLHRIQSLLRILFNDECFKVYKTPRCCDRGIIAYSTPDVYCSEVALIQDTTIHVYSKREPDGSTTRGCLFECYNTPSAMFEPIAFYPFSNNGI